MPIAYALLLMLLMTGCARAAKPETPVAEPPSVATQPTPTQPAAPRPAARPPAPTTPTPRQPATGRTPAPVARTPAPGATASVAPPVVKAPTPALDLDALIARLKATKAIGIFTKITLRNQVDDLLAQFRDYYEGKAKRNMADLRRSYDLLMMKVLSLLQDEDQLLATAIVSSRESIWGLLADPKKFAALQG